MALLCVLFVPIILSVISAAWYVMCIIHAMLHPLRHHSGLLRFRSGEVVLAVLVVLAQDLNPVNQLTDRALISRRMEAMKALEGRPQKREILHRRCRWRPSFCREHLHRHLR